MTTENTGATKAQDTKMSESGGATAQQKTNPPATPENTEQVIGFSPFRAWANKGIRNLPGGVRMQYGGIDYAVTEITHDGQLRLERDDGSAVLLPFDERYIDQVLKQIL